MADRPSIAAMRRQMYIPENRPGYDEYVADPENQRKVEEAAMNLLALGMGPVGEIPAGLRLARNILGGYRIANKGQQYLPRPDRGNAMLPEEMLTPEGMAALPAPPQYPALPRPQRPQMSEEELQALELARMVGEGGPSFSKQEALRREVRRRPSEEEMQANERARMEGEGGLDPETAALIRAVREERERAMHEADLSRFEGEGGGAWTYTGPRYKYGLPATQGPREMIGWSNGSGLPTMAGRGSSELVSPYVRVQREERLPPYGMQTAGSQAAGENAAGPFFSMGSANLPTMARNPNFTRLGYESMLGGMGQQDVGSGAPPMTPADLFDMRTGGGGAGGMGNFPLPEGPSRDPQAVIMDQINREREAADAMPRRQFQRAAPAPRPTAPAAPAPEAPKSLLGRIFSGEDYQSSNALASDPRLAGYNARARQDEKINWGDNESAADFFRADAARRKMEQEGMATGGSANGREEAVKQALSMIHNYIKHGR